MLASLNPPGASSPGQAAASPPLSEWVRQGRPKTGKVCPGTNRSESGLMSLNQLSKRIAKKWEDAGFRPIGLQDSRHTAATWVDHAGAALKVGSIFMGHKAPSASPTPRGSPCVVTPTSCQASFSAPAISSTSSSLPERRRNREGSSRSARAPEVRDFRCSRLTS
jgi:hypothetical protein